jgi:dTDP-4-dehydrorhamnose reductase
MIKIIGTGLSGVVGSRVVELLKDRFDFIDFSLDSGVDLLNKDSLINAFSKNLDVDVVLHLAAFTDTNAAWEQRGDKNGICYRLNVGGTQNILDLCREHNKHLIYISTDFVFDGLKNTPYTEEDAPNPIEWYGETKYLGEKLILDSKHNASIVRITYPYRANFNQKPDIVHKVLTKLQNGETLKMFSDQICTYTFIDDIAQGIGKIIDNKNQGIYHLVGSSSHSPFEMARMVANTFGYDSSLVTASNLDEYIKSQPSGSRPWQKNLITSNKKIESLGVKMATLEQGLIEVKRQISLD